MRRRPTRPSRRRTTAPSRSYSSPDQRSRDHLQQDHRRVESLFASAALTGGARRRRALLLIAHELTVHAQLEEEVIYPAIADVLGGGEALIDRAQEEHDAMKALIARLGRADPSDPEDLDDVRTLNLASLVLYDAIDAGVYPEWELGLQLFPDTEDQMFEGIDLLDATKIVPEELAPVERVGRLTLDRNVTDFFAETEQVAFCTAHLVPGIEATDDPLLQARNFSYLDTQITRLGGPNFEFLPINRSRAPVNPMMQDGFGQTAILAGRTWYSPNSLGGGCPFTSSMAEGGYERVARMVSGPVVRERQETQPDYFSQATLSWNSMSPIEREHIAGAFSFELGKVEVAHVRERMLQNLALVDAELVAKVAAALGTAPPTPPDGSAVEVGATSPALSQVPSEPGPLDGRVIAVLAADGCDAEGVMAFAAAATAAGARAQIVAPHLGVLESEGGMPVPATKAFLTAQSVEFDAVVVAGGIGTTVLAGDPLVAMFVQEAYRHHKTIAAWGAGVEALAGFMVPDSEAGIVTSSGCDQAFTASVLEQMGWHRHWERTVLLSPPMRVPARS